MPICQALGAIRLGRLRPKAVLCYALLLPLFFPACALLSLAPQPAKPQGVYHVVKRKENLFRIGKAYDIPYRELARINGIEDPHQIRVGQRVFIPGATRQLPVEIITPLDVSLERSSPDEPLVRSQAGFIWPTGGNISSKFGPRGETFHDGIDILAREGSPIQAVEQGEVIYSDQLRGYGNIIIIRHPGGFASVYAHNRTNRVVEGQRVVQGETIAEVGSTGRVSAAHLHFEIRKDNIARDPLYYLPQ